MPKRSTMLKKLLRQRHWQTYATFCRQYDAAAQQVDPTLIGHWPSRGQFARWLSGDIKGLPHPDHCRVLETMFPGLTVDELFTAPDATAANARMTPSLVPTARRPSLTSSLGLSLRRPETSVETPTGRTDDDAGAQPPSTYIDLTGEVPTGLLDRPTGGLSGLKNPAPHHPANTSLPEEMAMTTEQSAQFVRAARGGVDSDVLDQLTADVRQLATDYLVKPPLVIFRPLSRLRAEVFEMLERRQRPAVLPPLYSVAGRLCALLAHASADLGQTYAADTHTRTAWLCADLADDDGLRSYIRWVQSNVAFWEGDYRQAATIAQSGQQFAAQGSSNMLRLASQEARAWAACGQTAEVERALSVTMTTRDAATPDDSAGVFRFDPGKAAYYASEVRLALGGRSNAERAVEAAEESLRLFGEAPEAQRSPEFVAAAQLDLANARLALDDLDGAEEQLRTVLTLPVESRTQPIVGRVKSAGASLKADRFAHSGLATSLRDEIALFRAYPAQRDFPEESD
ncbi:hypothetical protein ACIB24_15375 [Spongisporangium articulatum]|uniref:XRE family transcriptional regulator n=1 Tax=Spongisporangium articulatum TaxID=3362603 RepID=A0ABW8APY9_9ACTN